MKVILTQDIARLGSQGDVVNVKDGFGRNHLIPSGKALPATPANLARLKDKMRVAESRVRKDRKQAEEVAERLGGVSCTVRVQADEHDKLYGSVGPREIAAALEDQGVVVESGSVLLTDPIKLLGVYPVRIRIFKDVEAEIRVWVIRE